jgi:hypothetical protein
MIKIWTLRAARTAATRTLAIEARGYCLNAGIQSPFEYAHSNSGCDDLCRRALPSLVEENRIGLSHLGPLNLNRLETTYC